MGLQLMSNPYLRDKLPRWVHVFEWNRWSGFVDQKNGMTWDEDKYPFTGF